MIDKVKRLEEDALSQIKAVSSKEDILRIKGSFLGKKGALTLCIKELKDLPKELRGSVGKQVNLVKVRLEGELGAVMEKLIKEERQSLFNNELPVDITLPGRRPPVGRIHPVTQVTDEIVDIFLGIGFEVAGGPEIEEDYYNFAALNMPKDHPARDMQDTFYIDAERLLRTHTSPVQIRVMKNGKPPLRVIAPGTAYRRDSDVSHTPMFHQVEGFMVDHGVTFRHLKGVLTVFLHEFFGKDISVRFRPSFFPFTEPSAEVDIECVICEGKGCRVCKWTGWLEVLGAGMINPAVFRAVDYDSEYFTGFAFGMGIERLTMLRFGINDIRLLFENDIRFLSQF